MQIGTSIFLIALGAILRFAVDVSSGGFNINTAGLILMIVGIAGLLISLFFLARSSDRGTVVRERSVERPVVRERDVY